MTKRFKDRAHVQPLLLDFWRQTADGDVQPRKADRGAKGWTTGAEGWKLEAVEAPMTCPMTFLDSVMSPMLKAGELSC